MSQLMCRVLVSLTVAVLLVTPSGGQEPLRAPLIEALISMHKASIRDVVSIATRGDKRGVALHLRVPENLARTAEARVLVCSQWGVVADERDENRAFNDKFVRTTMKVLYDEPKVYLKGAVDNKVNDSLVVKLFELLITQAERQFEIPEAMHGVQLAGFTLTIGPVGGLSGRASEALTFDAKVVLLKVYPDGRRHPFKTVDVSYVLRMAEQQSERPSVIDGNTASPIYDLLGGKDAAWEPNGANW